MQTGLTENGHQEVQPVSRTSNLPEYQVDLFDIAFVIIKRRGLIIFSALVFAAISIAVAFLLPKTYRSTCKILPPQQNQSASSALTEQLGAMASMVANAPFKTPSDLYVGLLQTDPVLDALIAKYDLRNVYKTSTSAAARMMLSDRTEIVAGKEGIITIAVEDRDAQRAADLANGYIAELSNLSSRLAITDAARRRLFFESQLKKAQESLTLAETAMTDTQKSTGVIQPESQSKAIIDAVVGLRSKVATAEVAVQGLRSYATEQNPDRIRAEQELSALRHQLAALEQGGGSKEDVIVPTRQMPEAGMEYARKLRDVKTQEAVFAMLVRQYELARLDEARDSVLIQVVQPAAKPEVKASPKRFAIVLLGTMGGFVVSCLIAFTLERRNQIWFLSEGNRAKALVIKQMLHGVQTSVVRE